MSATTLSDLALPSTWQEQAACRDADPELFFSSEDGSRHEALSLCGACPVRTDCLEHALAHRETYGIWGGTDEQERKRLVRRRRRHAA